MDVTHWPNTWMNHYLSPTAQILTMWALMIIVLRLGKFGTVFRVYNTLFHEIGHALMSLLFSGSVNRIELFSNAGGVALTSNKSWIARFMVSLAGYPFAAAMSWFLLTQLDRIPAIYHVPGMLGLLVLALVLWVRNKYGIIWLLVNILLLSTALYFNYENYAGIFFFIIGSLTMIESIYSVLILLYISAESPAEAGDARNLRELALLPAVIWALILAAICFFFLHLTIKDVLNWSMI